MAFLLVKVLKLLIMSHFHVHLCRWVLFSFSRMIVFFKNLYILFFQVVFYKYVYCVPITVESGVKKGKMINWTSSPV